MEVVLKGASAQVTALGVTVALGEVLAKVATLRVVAAGVIALTLDSKVVGAAMGKVRDRRDWPMEGNV